MKSLKRGDLVRIRRSRWGPDTGELGVVLKRTYLAYEEKNSRWNIMVGDIVREVVSANLFPVKNEGNSLG